VSPSSSTVAHERPINVVIVDDHPLVREGLRRVIDGRRSARLVAEAESVEAALAIPRDDIDVFTLDLSLPGTSGLDGIGLLKARWPQAKILVLTVHGADTHAPVCAERGAAGFLSKSAPPNEIRSVIAHLAAGGRHFPDSAESVDLGRYTTRELEVLRMLDHGQRVTDIARAFGVSVKTISTHKMSLQKKLGAANTAQILERARAQGLLA
jgi:two-component system, NarL family, invasion response regulator UvrY